MKFWNRWLALVGVMGMSACSFTAPNSGEQTLAADNATLSTALAEVRATATAQADRMQVTLEYAGTMVRSVDVQTERLAATLAAQGVSVDPSIITPAPTQFFGGPSGQSGVNPPDSSGFDPNSPSVGVGTPTGTPAPLLSNIVMAVDVGQNDCALAQVTEFPADTQKIYVVATASNTPTGTPFTFHWNYNGQEMASFPWSPTNDIQQACIWYFITPDDIPFTPGSWSVSVDMNGTPVGAPVPFTILGDTPTVAS